MRFLINSNIQRGALLPRTAVKSTVILLPLLGITWVFGLLAVNENTTVFAWLFTLCNSLQVCYSCTSTSFAKLTLCSVQKCVIVYACFYFCIYHPSRDFLSLSSMSFGMKRSDHYYQLHHQAILARIMMWYLTISLYCKLNAGCECVFKWTVRWKRHG